MPYFTLKQVVKSRLRKGDVEFLLLALPNPRLWIVHWHLPDSWRGMKHFRPDIIFWGVINSPMLANQVAILSPNTTGRPLIFGYPFQFNPLNI